MQRATKIVATIGPASSDRDTLTRMIKDGYLINVARGKLVNEVDLVTATGQGRDDADHGHP